MIILLTIIAIGVLLCSEAGKIILTTALGIGIVMAGVAGITFVVILGLSALGIM